MTRKATWTLDLDTATVDELRAEYRRIRDRSHADSPRTFDTACRKAVEAAGDAAPQAWVRAARQVSFPCRRCMGTGQYVARVENGKGKGNGGECFRCAGKGRRDDADQRRNYGYDKSALRRAVG